MRVTEVMQAWGAILAGRKPSLSIEITRECPLRCPGCYAYEDNHLGGGTTLRQLSDFRGDELVERVVALVQELKPLHVSLVGGDPLVRYREVDRMLPQLLALGSHVQVVTSAFREIPQEWSKYEKVSVVVSIDGLEQDHDVRRAPATYARITRNITGAKATVHCTITRQMMRESLYLERFTQFWSAQDPVRKIWFSIFTPQRGADLPEILTPDDRARVARELLDLRQRYPKIDMVPSVIRHLIRPPASPEDCTFAQTTATISADMKTRITPCQFGGDPDCSQCGCIASMGLAALADHRLGGLIKLGHIFKASSRIGRAWNPRPDSPQPEPAFRILSS